MGNIAKVLKNKNAMVLVFTFACVLGFANTYGAVSGILVNALGFDDKAASLFGTMFILGAIVGAAVFGVIVEIYKNYKSSTVIICGMGAIAGGFVEYSLYIKSNVLSCISFVFTGAALALLPVGIDFACELTYPAAESVSTGILMSVGNVIGMILTISIGVIIGHLDATGAYISMGLLTGTAIISLVLGCFIKEDLRRQKEEKKQAAGGRSPTTAHATTLGNLSCEETARDDASTRPPSGKKNACK